ncbi:uncharacterized protein KD926_002361 [Aspergillus affinis]|uniref:uncharacterized protein n=1 Tax=Aspergillus affinis TaxID=1070780 RepID=UPI0022FE101D|nr:uncharacterized protein KD926_002361 [Aspergillus affinis]KAI9043982.1 hypothetical protein KD926_002361 [Aspergillus affinis]
MSSIQQTYPLYIDDLTKRHLSQLMEVLTIDSFPPEGGTSVEGRIKEAIKKLPWDLRRQAFIRIVPNAVIQPAILCEPHTGMNPYVINDVFILIKREVTEHLRCLKRYTGEIDPELRLILTELKGMRGLWRSDPNLKSYLQYMKVSYQHSSCEACMLVKIIETPVWLQNLRTTLLSRTRTRAKPQKPHRPPQLLRFVDRSIETHPDLVTDMFYKSGQIAYGLKAVRKLAVQQNRQACKGKDHEDDKREDEQMPDDKHRKRQTIVVYWGQEAREQLGTAETLSSPTAVETANSTTAVEDDDILQAMHGKTTPGEMTARKMTPSEALINEIIAEYAGLTGTTNMEDARQSLLVLEPDVAPPTPLSVTKPGTRSPSTVSPTSPYASPYASPYSTSSPATSPCVTSPYYGTEPLKPSFARDSSIGGMKSKFSTTRDTINWRKVIHKSSPLDNLSSRAASAFRDINGTTERIAFEYRDLLSPQEKYEYSDSEYSFSPTEERPRPNTTWEDICENMNIEQPRPQLKETKRGKGLLRMLKKTTRPEVDRT